MDALVQLQENVPLGPLTTLGIGGPARYFIQAATESQVLAGLTLAKKMGLPTLVLGGGSNILVSDDGFHGVVVHLASAGVSFKGQDKIVYLSAQAGEVWDRIVAEAVDADLAGLECLSGIPGSVGGTPVQNVGAYGQEVADTISRVRVLDRREGHIIEMSPAECHFAYRGSLFNRTAIDRFVVLEVTYRLVRGGSPHLQYADLRQLFAGRKSRPSLQETRDAVLAIRRRKGMVIDPTDPDSRSAGSFFKNPIVPLTSVQAIQRVFPDLPVFDLEDGMFKLPAAWLIERAGFKRGESRGTVAISTKHALALVNSGGATAKALLGLANEIQTGVREMFKIELQNEPVMVGFPKVDPYSS